ncbi:signal peptidase [Paraburkholderia flava]|uniref:signal peptidase n=1 Tax=Paraburkholderia flava TaxID=2547393 RepID=UPI00105C8A18|nr:signal peptidase [Paraburkholderia flava]
MKIRYATGALAIATIAAVTLTGCATNVRSLPLGTALAQPTGGDSVQLYFGSQSHPAVKTQLGEVSASARLARKTDGEKESCDATLADALAHLRGDARSRHGNAVINIRTSFHSTETAAPDTFTCGVSGSAAALHVRGDVVVLDNGQQ